MIRFAVVRTGTADPGRCRHCAPAKDAEYFPFQAILSEARNVIGGWDPSALGPNISLRGPEPLAHPQAPELLGALGQLELERLCVTTQGTAALHGDPVPLLLAGGVTHVRAIVLGPDATLHDELTGVQGSYEGATRLLCAVRTAFASRRLSGMPCAEIPVCRHNVDALPATIVSLAKSGVRTISLETSNLTHTTSARAWLEAAEDTGVVSGVWVSEMTGPEGCGPGELLGREPVRMMEATA